MTPRAWSRVQKEWTPGPSAPGTGARTADEPVAIRQSSYATDVPSSRVHTFAFVSSAVARLPRWVVTPQSASTFPVAVVRQDHPRVRPLRAHQRDRRPLGLLFTDGTDRVHPGGAAADDQVSSGHHRTPARTRSVRSRAKSPSQSPVVTSS